MCGVYIHMYRVQRTSGVLAIIFRFISWRQSSISLNLELGRWPEISFNPQSPACTVLRATEITVRIYFFMWVPEIWTGFIFVYHVLLPAEPSHKHLGKTLLDSFLTTYIRRIQNPSWDWSWSKQDAKKALENNLINFTIRRFSHKQFSH